MKNIKSKIILLVITFFIIFSNTNVRATIFHESVELKWSTIVSFTEDTDDSNLGDYLGTINFGYVRTENFNKTSYQYFHFETPDSFTNAEIYLQFSSSAGSIGYIEINLTENFNDDYRDMNWENKPDDLKLPKIFRINWDDWDENWRIAFISITSKNSITIRATFKIKDEWERSGEMTTKSNTPRPCQEGEWRSVDGEPVWKCTDYDYPSWATFPKLYYNALEPEPDPEPESIPVISGYSVSYLE